MHDPRAAFRSLLEDPKLDDLVDRAKKHAEKVAPAAAPSPAAAEAHFDEAISKVSAAAVNAQASLRAAAQAKVAERAEKVALAKHIVKVAARLLSAA